MQVTTVGSEQVQFVFRFKAGPDPKAGLPGTGNMGSAGSPRVLSAGPAAPRSSSTDGSSGAGGLPASVDPGGPVAPRPPITPLPPAPGVTVRIDEILFTDNRGQTFSVVDQGHPQGEQRLLSNRD